ncbi:TetR/AcrR family transcriptional regulator [Eubacteriales bacterium OttesenSCG-928-M02]|nr:TetR/AcrR family transcriptional regulator [Eubacteriales bacterium OttesenSCG-928-M02]
MNQTDQRVVVTRLLLKNALVDLMTEQSISKISVRALCERAGINRSTFYAHYQDPYDLLRKTEQEVLGDLRRYVQTLDFIENQPITRQALVSVLEYIKENAGLFRVLLNEFSDSNFHKDIVELAQVISSHANRNVDDRTREYLQEFGIAGYISIFRKWVNDGMVESIEQLADFVMQMLYDGVFSFVN